MNMTWKVIFALLCLLTALPATRAADPPLATFTDASVWASPNASASGTTESVTINPAISLIPPVVRASDWSFVPRDLTADTVTLESDGSARFQVGKSDGVDWHYQAGPSKLVLTEGKTYVLSFQAKADKVRTISVHAQASGGDYHGTGLNADVPLTTDWQTTKLTFTAKNVTSSTQIVFNLGQQNGVTRLADLSLTEHSDTPALAVQTTALKISVKGKGSSPFDVQTLSKPFDITNGQTYLLSFKAKSDAPRSADIVVRINGGDYHAVSDFGTIIALGTSWHPYTLAFTAANSGSGNNVVALSLGDQTGTTWIADMKLTHTGAGVVQKSELPVVPPVAVVSMPANAYRILFVGNSITQHGFDASSIQDLGWDHLSGMAASTQGNDYVHLLVSKIQALMPKRPIATRIVSLVPGGLGTTPERLAPVLRDSAGFQPDLVVIQHGEHELEPRGIAAVTETYGALLDIFAKSTPRPIIVGVGNWSTDVKPDGSGYQNWSAELEHAMAFLCAARGIPFVPVASIASDPLDHGTGTSPGVQWHPNDRAHAKYADAIFTAVRPMLTKNAARLPQTPHALHTARKVNP